jgi:hypothetical protein
MRQNMMILSEREIKKLIKKMLLKEDSNNKTIGQIQDLLKDKGYNEVGITDSKAGQNTLAALNKALGLGLNLYSPQKTAKQNTQTNTNTQSTSVVKNPLNFGSNAMTTKDNIQQTGDNTLTKGQTLTTPNDANAAITPNANDNKGVSFSTLKL